MDYTVLITAVLSLFNALVLYYVARKDKQKDTEKENLRNLTNRVSILEGRYVTSTQVEKLLMDKVDPLERSLQMLEREMRESHKDLSREFRESNQETREALHSTHLVLSKTLSDLAGDVRALMGSLEIRRSSDKDK